MWVWVGVGAGVCGCAHSCFINVAKFISINKQEHRYCKIDMNTYMFLSYLLVLSLTVSLYYIFINREIKEYLFYKDMLLFQGAPHTSIESEVDYNDLCLVPNSGMLFLATEDVKLQTYFLPVSSFSFICPVDFLIQDYYCTNLEF